MKSQIRVGMLLVALGLSGMLCLNAWVPSANSQLSGLLSSGVTMTETTTANNRTSTVTVYFSGNAIKRATAEGQDTIMRLDDGKIISVDNKKRTYSEMTFAEMQKAVDEASAAMAGNEEAMEAVKKMMGGAMASLTVSKQGPGEAIAGYATEKYLVTGPMEMEIWAAPDLKVPPAYFDAIAMRMPANPVLDMRKMFDALKQINGWPLKNITKIKMMGMSMTSTVEVTSVQKGPVPPSTFEVPAGFKLVKEKFD
ncbi:MAG: hypothetical protein H6Q05_880 [Acidobacteria bacterium]|jgi:hypothetical protein|nr:hypothetical protein [Acidobacteriota bacterium]